MAKDDKKDDTIICARCIHNRRDDYDEYATILCGMYSSIEFATSTCDRAVSLILDS